MRRRMLVMVLVVMAIFIPIIFKLSHKESVRVAGSVVPGGDQEADWEEEEGPIRISEAVHRISGEHGIPPQLVNAIIQVESQGNPNAVSKKGAMGLMQLMPALIHLYQISDPFDPLANIEAGVRHLKYLLQEFSGDIPLALAAYNAGPGTVRKYGGVPPFPETRNFTQSVLKECQRELNELGLLVQPLRLKKIKPIEKMPETITAGGNPEQKVALLQKAKIPEPEVAIP